jgi:predicted NBD/HSP70 family sugar kinase
MLDPGMIIMGGELAVGGPALIRAVRETLRREASPAAGHDCDVVLGSLGPAAETRGAAVLAMQHTPSEVVQLG